VFGLDLHVFCYDFSCGFLLGRWTVLFHLCPLLLTSVYRITTESFLISSRRKRSIIYSHFVSYHAWIGAVARFCHVD
jgi:hypothetical protein